MGRGTAGTPKNLGYRKPYRGVNVFLLAFIAYAKGHQSSFWCTYKQCQEMGGQVKKGEKSAMIVFFKQYETTECRPAIPNAFQFSDTSMSSTPSKWTAPRHRQPRMDALHIPAGRGVRAGSSRAAPTVRQSSTAAPVLTGIQVQTRCTSPSPPGSPAPPNNTPR